MNKKILIRSILFILIIVLVNISEVKAGEILEHYEQVDGNITTGYIKEHITREKCRENINTKFKNNILLAEQTFESSKRYYYNQLPHDLGRRVYTSLYNDTTGIGKATSSITDYKYTLSGTTEEDVSQCFNSKLLPYVLDGLVAFIDDNPERYWYFYEIDVAYTYRKDDLTNQISFENLEILSLIPERSNKISFDSKMDQVASSINGSTTYETLRQIHDYVCKNVNYEQVTGGLSQTAYGSLMLNKAVCEGQAALFEVLCRKKGIICIMIGGVGYTGSAQDYHAWNYVLNPSNQKWYGVDVTWDNHSDGSTGDYNFFMVGSNTVINNMTFINSHVPGMKSYDIQTHIGSVPTLAPLKYEEFKVVGTLSATNITNKDVIVTLKANKQMILQDGWTLSQDKLSMTKTYTKNSKEILTIQNTDGEKINVTINITNIDKNPPVITGIVENQILNEDTPVTITDEHSVKIILTKDGVKVPFTNGGKITQNGNYIIQAIDEAGNITEISFKMEKQVKPDDIESIYYEVADERIKAISPKTFCKDFKTKISCELTYEIKDVNDKILTDTEYIGTNGKVVVETGRKYTTVVYGDTDGNGMIDLNDIAKAQKIYLNIENGTDIEKIAFDLNNNGGIDLNDMAKLQKAFIGIENI